MFLLSACRPGTAVVLADKIYRVLPTRPRAGPGQVHRARRRCIRLSYNTFPLAFRHREKYSENQPATQDGDEWFIQFFFLLFFF